MADSRENAALLLKCALSTERDVHIWENPIQLSCGHFICKTCISKNIDFQQIVCFTCGKTNLRDLTQPIEATTSESTLISTHLNDAFHILVEEFSKKVKYCKNIESNSQEDFNLKVESIRHEIQLRIATLQVDLNNLNNSLNNELDKIKKDYSNSNRSSHQSTHANADIGNFEHELKKIKSEIAKNENLTQKNLYEFQNKVKEINSFIEEHRKSKVPRIEFRANKANIERNLIGKIIFDYGIDADDEIVNEHVLKTIKEKRFEFISLDKNNRPCDLCVLPNGKLLSSNFDNSKLYLYDSSLELIKSIDFINGNKHMIMGLDTNKQDAVFLSAHDNHLIIKTDLEFNELASFGGNTGHDSSHVKSPCGLCFSKGSVYVCDHGNKRIVKLSEDLKFEASFNVGYIPWYIKIIGNVACVREHTFLMEVPPSIHFHNVETFTTIRKYDGHNGVIGASSLYFYEYYHSNNTLYCYKKSGELMEEFHNDFGLVDESVYPNGSICLFKSHLLVCSRSHNVIKI